MKPPELDLIAGLYAEYVNPDTTNARVKEVIRLLPRYLWDSDSPLMPALIKAAQVGLAMGDVFQQQQATKAAQERATDLMKNLGIDEDRLLEG